MMQQTFIDAKKEEIVDRSLHYAHQGFRLIQILCTKTASEMFILYSFENQDLNCENIRIEVQVGDTIPSISKIFHPAFLYENEIHDLYGVNFTGMLVDFQGTLYETAVKFPFSATDTNKE